MTLRTLLAVGLMATFESIAADERALGMLNAWIVAVDDHVAAEKDDALERLAGWTHDEVELVLPYVEAFGEVPADTRDRAVRRRRITGTDLALVRQRTRDLQARGDFDRFRKRAVILHTDTAILESSRVMVEPPRPFARRTRDELAKRVDVLSADGRVDHYELANPHWEFAMSLLDSLPRNPRRDPIVSDWYRAIGAHFANEGRYADALRHFQQARRVVSDAPEVLFGEACLQETLAAPRVQDYVRVTTLPNGLTIQGVSSPQTHLRRAETLLRRALAAEARFVEANLRLGRVLTQLERHEEALNHLNAAIRDSQDRTITYYAHLFSGDGWLALSRPVDARSSYRGALEIYPNAQAARLGLGAALRTLGDRQAAVEAVAPALTRPVVDRESDPWWDYYLGDAANIATLLAELRAPFKTRQ